MKTIRIFIAITALSYGLSLFAADAADLYKTKCQACHAADGGGDTPAGKKLGAQSFSSAEFKKQTDEQLFISTKSGKNKMPAFSGKLTDDQIKDLVKYIRTLSK
jgi:mono/diheme cytochrome c family protein